ncbi:hypothetical protein PG996_003035 [Apiospora saccharicola]|uniref:Uncharacterized protein n=1 Tax=Apiospora saccharicola TaxID=335842 RepID=A0ABR1W315_9PEZI
MDDSSDRSVYGGLQTCFDPYSNTQFVPHRKTPRKPSYTIAANTESPSKASMSKKAAKKYMAKKNNGGDPVTALSLRDDSSSKSVSKRRSKVESEVAASIAKLNGDP